MKGYLASLGALGMEEVLSPAQIAQVLSPAQIAHGIETVESVKGTEFLAKILLETVVVRTACSATKQSKTSQATKKVVFSATVAKKKKGPSTKNKMEPIEKDEDEESFESTYSESSNSANENDGESTDSELSIDSNNTSTVDRNPSDETRKEKIMFMQ